MKPQLVALKKYNYGKQIAAIEKLIFTGAQTLHQTQLAPYNSNINPGPAAATKPLPLDTNSCLPTPVLTMEQNSPRSSSPPSTNTSTVDGPTELANKKVGIGKTVMPEVRIETV
jgi:mRNA-binding protein PUF3